MKKLVAIVILLVLLMPMAASGQGGVVYTAGFQLQNLNPTQPASVVIDFYSQDGTSPANSQVSDSIPAGSSKTYYPLGSLQEGFNGSAVVSSDQQLAAITNVLGNNGQRGAAYSGFTTGAQTVNLPLVMKSFFGISTWFNVQNTGSADANVTVTYKGGPACTDTFTIKPGAAHTFDQAQTACLGGSFVGGATVTSNQNIVAVVMQVNASSLLAYSGFTATSTNPIFPLVSSNFYWSGTGLAIQNAGTQATDVTVSYTPSGGGLPGNACTETKNILAGATATFGYTQLPAACGQTGVTGVTDPTNGGFVGSARVSANSANQPLTAIANSVTRNPADQGKTTVATGDAYNAFDASQGTSRVSLPLIMDRNFKIFTGFSIVNVGTQATSIACTFTGTSYTVSANNVAPGGALTTAQQNQIANGYVGSATCTATGGDAKIVGIVNEVTGGAPATTDALLIYPAFNF